MKKDATGGTKSWTPPPRPSWLADFLAETAAWDLGPVAPLEADELIATAIHRTGHDDFGSDDWRQPFEILIRAIRDEAALHFFGRLWTRQDILLWLENRLRIEAEYKAHPEIEDEVIDRPVFVTGLPRSGTSILFELMAQDPQFMAPANWEFVLPCPPPEAATYRTDPRVPRAHELITQFGRVAPTMKAMHEAGAWIPNECGQAFPMSFRAHHIAGILQVPSYAAWLATADRKPTYRHYKRLLKLLQWRNPRRHWLLKAPEHQSFLPDLFAVFPNAQVVITHRDPVVAQGSVTNVMGTLYWMRSDKIFDARAFEELLTPEGMAARLEQVIDCLEAGTIPAGQTFNLRYADLIEAPLDALARLYTEMGAELTEESRVAAAAYLAAKPSGKFGAHRYAVDRDDTVRRLFARYQSYFDIPSEE